MFYFSNSKNDFQKRKELNFFGILYYRYQQKTQFSFIFKSFEKIKNGILYYFIKKNLIFFYQ